MRRVAVVGVSGRMGLCLVKAVVLSEQAELTVAVSRPESDAIGKDAGELAGIGSIGITVVPDLLPVTDQFDVLIDLQR